MSLNLLPQHTLPAIAHVRSLSIQTFTASTTPPCSSPASIQLLSLTVWAIFNVENMKTTFTLAQSPGHSAAMRQSNSASSSSSYANKPKFILFPRLPIELRLKIWKESHEPRIIELRFTRDWKLCRYDFIVPKFPAVLHVNKEARLESLKYYKFSFKHRQCRRPVLFNFSIDTLHIRDYTPGDQHLLGRMALKQNSIRILPDKEKVQKLSVTSSAFKTFSLGGGIRSIPLILLFPALKEVTVCSPFNGEADIEQHGEFYLKSHLGECVPSSSPSSCFPKNCNLTLIPENGAHRAQPIPNINESFFSSEKSLVNDFLRNQRSGEWEGIKWLEPSFSYRGLCLKRFYRSDESFYCPPRPKKSERKGKRQK